MRILHVLPSYAVAWGGPPKIAFQIAEGTKHLCEIDILSSVSTDEELVKVPEGVRFISFKRSWFHRFWRSFSPQMEKFLLDHVQNYDLIHIHELWLHHMFAASKAAFAKKVPYIVTIHGELDPWALGHKGFKKEVFSKLFQKNALQNAAAIHIGTDKERHEVKAYLNGETPPLYEIPNALLDESFHLEADSIMLEIDYDEPYILFLARLNIKKGCNLLIEAFAAWNLNTKYKLVLAGPPEPLSYADELKTLVSSLGLTDRVVFVGMVSGSTKKRLLKHASLFALTSYAEGFPVAILEALQAGCPLLLSNKCGFDGFLESKGAAITCHTNTASVLKGLEKFGQLDQEELEAIKQNGPKIISEYYSSKKISGQYIQMYKQVLEKL